MEGWFKIHRSIADKGWASDAEYLALWVHLLILATHKEREVLWNGKIIRLQPGQLITGRNQLMAKTGINRSKVDRILKLFESEQQIEQQMTSTSRLISIINWLKFQTSEPQFEPRLSHECATNEPRVSTKQECNNEKNVNNVKKKSDSVRFTPPTHEDVVHYFLEKLCQPHQADRFFNYYTANGWKAGRNAMKDWKAAARNWITKDLEFNQNKPKKNGTASIQTIAESIQQARYIKLAPVNFDRNEQDETT